MTLSIWVTVSGSRHLTLRQTQRSPESVTQIQHMAKWHAWHCKSQLWHITSDQIQFYVFNIVLLVSVFIVLLQVHSSSLAITQPDVSLSSYVRIRQWLDNVTLGWKRGDWTHKSCTRSWFLKSMCGRDLLTFTKRPMFLIFWCCNNLTNFRFRTTHTVISVDIILHTTVTPRGRRLLSPLGIRIPCVLCQEIDQHDIC